METQIDSIYCDSRSTLLIFGILIEIRIVLLFYKHAHLDGDWGKIIQKDEFYF